MARLLVLVCLTLVVASQAASLSRHKHHHRHKVPQEQAPPVPMAGFPQPMMGAPAPMFMPGVPPFMGAPGVPGVPNPEMRFAEALAQTHADTHKQGSGVVAQADIVRSVYNLLAKTRDQNTEDKSRLASQTRDEEKKLQDLKNKQHLVKQRQSLLARLEYCLEADAGQVRRNTTSAGAAAKGAAATSTQKKQEAELAKKKAEVDARMKEYIINEAKLKQQVADFKKAQASEAQAKKDANAKMQASSKPKVQVKYKEKVKVKYVKVPETIYKTAPQGCAVHRSCGSCAADAGCGWCQSSKKCIGSTNGTTSQCDAASWNYNFCKFQKCEEHINCHSCMADPRCGMCSDTGKCMDGTLTGPKSGMCTRWNYAVDMRFISWNIYGRDLRNCSGRAWWIFKLLKQADADFIALQEVEDWFLEELSKQKWALNYHMSDFGSGHAPGGLLFLSKIPLESVSYYEKTDPGQVEVDQRGRMLVVKPKIGSRNFALATTNLDWRNSHNRIASMDFMFSALNITQDVALMGDFNFDANAYPESERIPSNYEDVWQKVHPTQKGFTWDPTQNSYAKASDPTSAPSRIDRMFVKSGFWQPSKIDKIGCPEASPHYGLMAEFSMFGAYC